MEPTVRSPRIKSAIGSDAAEARISADNLPSAGWSVVPKPCRRERKFWMQRPGAKNPPERALLSAETVNAQNRPQDPRRNGLFSIDGGFRGSGRLGGGVRSHTRTGLGQPPLLFPDICIFSGKE